MVRFRILLWIIVLLLLSVNYSFAANGISKKGHSFSLGLCYDKELDIKLLCDETWKIESDKNVFMIIIAENPSVTLTVTRNEAEIDSLTQLNRNTLSILGGYKDGFRLQTTRIDKLEALEVVGFHQEQENTYLRDYYFLKGSYLYSVLFSIEPKKEWMNYYPLVRQIIDSIEVGS